MLYWVEPFKQVGLSLEVLLIGGFKDCFEVSRMVGEADKIVGKFIYDRR